MPKPVSQPQSNLHSDNRLFEHALKDGHHLKISPSAADREHKSSLTKDGNPVQNYVFRFPPEETVAKLCGRVTPSQIKCKTYGDLVEIGVEDPQQGLRGGGISFSKASIQKPKGIDPSECKEDYSSAAYHLLQDQRRNSFSQSAPQPFPAIADMRSTRELAKTIQAMAKSLAAKKKKNDVEVKTHGDFVKFVREAIVKAFKDITPKTPRIFQELTELVLSDNAEICRDVLELIFTEIASAAFEHGNIMTLQALQDVLRKTNPAHFNPLQLVEILRKVAGACDKIHSQYKTLPELHLHVEVIADILVAMADAKVSGISFEEHDSLYRFLDEVSKDPNQIVFTNKAALLAIEALINIKHDRTDLDLTFHRLIAFAKGVNYVVATASDYLLIENMEAMIHSFREAFHKQRKPEELKPGEDKRGWYQHFRFLDVIIKNKQWESLDEEFLNSIAALPSSEYPNLLTHIIYALNIIVSSDLEMTDNRVKALAFLHKLYMEDGSYSLRTILHSQLAKGTNGDVRGKIHVELLREFRDYAKSHNSRVSKEAKAILRQIKKTEQKGTSETTWFTDAGLNESAAQPILREIKELRKKGNPEIAWFTKRGLDETVAKAILVKVNESAQKRSLEPTWFTEGRLDANTVKTILRKVDELKKRGSSGITWFIEDGVDEATAQAILKEIKEIGQRISPEIIWVTARGLDEDGAKAVLKKIEELEQKQAPESTWFTEGGLDVIDIIALKKLAPKGIAIERTHELLKASRALKIKSVETRIREMQAEYGNPLSDVNRLRLATFGELEGINLVTNEIVQVKDTLLEWLKGTKKAGLIESVKGGSGKTTLIEVFHHLAWQMLDELPAKTVIVKIRADAVKSTAAHVISNVLKEIFGDDNLEEVQKTCNIVVLIDEMDGLDLDANFFLANRGFQSLRILYTGRKAHLPSDPDELMLHLAHPEDKRFLHIRLMEFDKSKSKKTLAKYIAHDPKAPHKIETELGVFPYKEWGDVSKYEKFFAAHPEVEKMIRHPATLVSVFRGIPNLDAQEKSGKIEQVLTNDVIWFEIKELFVYERARIKSLVSITEDADIKKKYKILGSFLNNCITYCKDFTALAANIDSTAIEYVESIEEETGSVNQFFGNPNRQMYKETCLINNENNEFQLPEQRFFDFWLHKIIVEGLMGAAGLKSQAKLDKEELVSSRANSTATSRANSRANSAAPSPTGATSSRQRGFSFSLSSRPSESNFSIPIEIERPSSEKTKQRLWARLFSRKELEESVINLIAETVSREPELKSLLEMYAEEKAPSVKKLNSQNVLYALSNIGVYSDMDDFKKPELKVNIDTEEATVV